MATYQLEVKKPNNETEVIHLLGEENLVFSSRSSFPATGVSGVLYIATDEKKMYYWSTTNSEYILVANVGIETLTTGSEEGDKVTITVSETEDGYAISASHADTLGSQKTYGIDQATTYNWKNGCYIDIPSIVADSSGHITSQSGDYQLTIPSLTITEAEGDNENEIIVMTSPSVIDSGIQYKKETVYSKQYIDNYVSAAVTIRGTLGINGTVTALPAASENKIGDTYKVVTAATYNGIECDVGDLFIWHKDHNDNLSWMHVPSGDDVDTWRPISVDGEEKLEPNIDSGELNFYSKDDGSVEFEWNDGLGLTADVKTNFVSSPSQRNFKVTKDDSGNLYSNLDQATNEGYGVVKVAGVRDTAETLAVGSTTADRYYGVETDSDGVLFVNVPWSGGSSDEYSLGQYSATEGVATVHLYKGEFTTSSINFRGSNGVNIYGEDNTVSIVGTPYRLGLYGDDQLALYGSSSSTPDSTVGLSAGTGISISGSDNSIEIACTKATVRDLGVVRPWATKTSSISSVKTTDTNTSRRYGVILDSVGRMYVNVPWESGSSSSVSASDFYSGTSLDFTVSGSASANYSTAVGASASAGNIGVAIGSRASCSDEGVAVGSGASGGCGVAIGEQAKATLTGVAIGKSSKTNSGTCINAPGSTTDQTIYIGVGGNAWVRATSSSSGFSAVSDQRDKTDFLEIERAKALKFIQKLNPATFVLNERHDYYDEEGNFDEEGYLSGTKKHSRRLAGFKAQEVYESLHDVFGSYNYAQIVDINDYKGEEVQYSQYSLYDHKIVPFLVAAVQEQQKQIEDLKLRIIQLEATNE